MDGLTFLILIICIIVLLLSIIGCYFKKEYGSKHKTVIESSDELPSQSMELLAVKIEDDSLYQKIVHRNKQNKQNKQNEQNNNMKFLNFFDHDKLLIDGYIRQMQQLFINNQTIPREINEICYNYFNFNHVLDKWNIEFKDLQYID
eukprot:549050_1